MNFKEWLFTEEIYPNKTAVVYHRTTSEVNIRNILTSGFKSGEGCAYGCGFYSTFALESQFTNYMDQYGKYVIKFKVTDLEKYLIFQLSTAKYVLGKYYSISSQFRKFNIQATENQLKEYDEKQAKATFSSDLASHVYSMHPEISFKCKGIIFRGGNDGYVLVKYEPINDGSITILGYAEASSEEKDKLDQLSNNKGWITSTAQAKIKHVSILPDKEKRKSLSTMQTNYENLKDIIKNNHYMQFANLLKDASTSEIENIFRRVVEFGNLNFLKYLIEKEKFPPTTSLIRHASYYGHLHIIKYLVEEKNTEIPTNSDYVAATENHFDVVKYLIEHGAEISESTIVIVAQKGNMEMVRYLIGKGAKINENAVEMAVLNKHYDIVEYLIEKGARISYPTEKLIIKSGNMDLLKLIIKKLAQQNTDLTDDAVEIAAESGNLEIVKYLIDEKQSLISNSVLSYAIKSNNIKMVKYFIEEKNFKPSANDVTLASMRGNMEIIKYLVKKGGEIDFSAITFAKSNEIQNYLHQKMQYNNALG